MREENPHRAFEIRVSEAHGVGIIQMLRLHLDCWGDPRAFGNLMHEHIDRLLAAGTLAIVLDISGVGYLDSASVGDIVREFKHVREQRGLLKMVLDVEHFSLWRILHLERVLPAYQTSDDAIAAFRTEIADRK